MNKSTQPDPVIRPDDLLLTEQEWHARARDELAHMMGAVVIFTSDAPMSDSELLSVFNFLEIGPDGRHPREGRLYGRLGACQAVMFVHWPDSAARLLTIKYNQKLATIGQPGLISSLGQDMRRGIGRDGLPDMDELLIGARLDLIVQREAFNVRTAW
ncbi:MAG: hypothetical protein QOE23_2223 [Pseudonocardiales bacterium]|nr:hypothetical protein [Pseudonocardiales bacterium]